MYFLLYFGITTHYELIFYLNKMFTHLIIIGFNKLLSKYLQMKNNLLTLL